MKFALSFLLLVASPLLLIESSFASGDAIQQTKALLNNPEERNKVIASDPKAKKADDHLKSLGLSEKSQEDVYGLSGSIAEGMVEKSNGDSELMAKKLQEYLRDPASIEKDLSPQQKMKIHELSKELPDPSIMR
jgi:hypothetical protein